MRYCTGPIEQLAFKCENCIFSMHDEDGLKVHISRIHPEIWNEMLPTKRKKFQKVRCRN